MYVANKSYILGIFISEDPLESNLATSLLTKVTESLLENYVRYSLIAFWWEKAILYNASSYNECWGDASLREICYDDICE